VVDIFVVLCWSNSLHLHVLLFALCPLISLSTSTFASCRKCRSDGLDGSECEYRSAYHGRGGRKPPFLKMERWVAPSARAPAALSIAQSPDSSLPSSSHEGSEQPPCYNEAQWIPDRDVTKESPGFTTSQWRPSRFDKVLLHFHSYMQQEHHQKY
jgi:hypothetical protein